jgi:hypothetical protein
MIAVRAIVPILLGFLINWRFVKPLPLDMSELVKIILIAVVLSIIAGCCALPDAPGPIGIPGC